MNIKWLLLMLCMTQPCMHAADMKNRFVSIENDGGERTYSEVDDYNNFKFWNGKVGKIILEGMAKEKEKEKAKEQEKITKDQQLNGVARQNSVVRNTTSGSIAANTTSSIPTWEEQEQFEETQNNLFVDQLKTSKKYHGKNITNLTLGRPRSKL